MQPLAITNIKQLDGRTLSIHWTDQSVSDLDVVDLRRRCPCAVCVDELTSQRKLKDSDIDDKVRPLTIQSVGRYALTIDFNDGHRTGIYTFEMLKRLSS